MTERLQFIKRVGLIGLTNIINLLVSIILIPLFTKGKPLEYYGIWVQITVSLNLVPGLTCFGLPYALVRYLPGEKNSEKIREIVYSILSLVLIINTVFSPLIAYLIIKYVAGNQMNLLAPFIGLLITQSVYSVGIAYLRALQRIKKYSVILIAQNILTVILVGLVISKGYGIEAALKALLLINISITGLLIYEITKDIYIGIPRFKYIREHFKFGFPTIFGNFSDWIVSSSDRYLIGYFLGVISVGYYNPSYSLASLVNIFMWPLAFMLPPKLSELYENGEIAQIGNYLKYSLKYYLLLAIPSLFGISALSKPLLTIISTPEIASKSVALIPIVSTGVIFYGAYAIISQIFVIKKKTEFIAKVWMIAATVNFILNLIAIPYLGIIGAALTTLIAYTIALIFTASYSRKFFKIPIKKLDVLKSIISSFIMYFLIVFLKPESMGEIVFATFSGCLVYFLLIFVLGAINKSEIKALKE